MQKIDGVLDTERKVNKLLPPTILDRRTEKENNRFLEVV